MIARLLNRLKRQPDYTSDTNLSDAIRQIREGEADSVAATMQARYDRGDRTPQTLLALSAAYAYLGRGVEAEPFAREACAVLDKMRAFQREDRASRYICDLARLAVHDAILIQGRYLEAADYIRPYAARALGPKFMTVFIAWDHYLGGDETTARDMLRRDLPAGQTVENMTPMYLFILAYLRYKLLGMDTKAQLLYQRDALAKWEDTLARQKHNAYGARLQAIMDDIYALLRS